MSAISSPARAIASFRVGFGLALWLAPGPVSRLMGVDPAANPGHRLLGRLFAIRDLALGAGVLLAADDARPLWLGLGMMSDAADCAAVALAGRCDDLSRGVAAFDLTGAATALGLGIAGLVAGSQRAR